MRLRNSLVTAGAVAVLVIAGATTVAAVGGSQPVECTVTDNVLSCPLPVAPPVTTTETATATVTNTVTAAPVTTTATVTQPPVTSTVTATPTSTTTTSTTTTATPTTTTPPPGGFTVGSGANAMTFPEKPGLRTATTTLSPYTGPTNVTGNTTASNCIVTKQIRVAAGASLTLDNCWVKVNVADSGYGMIGKAGKITVTHSLIDGTGFGNYTFPLILEGGGRVAFTEFVGNTDNARLSSGVVFEWNYIHNPKTRSTEAAHSDGVEVYYGARPAGVVGPHIFVENNWISIEGASGGNSDVNVTNDFGPIDGVRVKGNTFMPGGGYSLYLRGDGYCGCGGDLKNIEVQNNRWFAGVGNNYGGYYGTRSYTPERGITDWSGNTFTRTTGESFPLTLENYQP